MYIKQKHPKKNRQTLYKLWSFLICFIVFFCFSCNTTKCDECIYKNADDAQFKFDAYHIDIPLKDTTYYSILMESGNSFFLAQNKLKYKVLKYQTYQKVKSNFKSESTTGFKENSEYIWLHPPRTDLFKRITQLAPYPQISLPPEIGKTYDGSIHMASNWGDWSGKSSSYTLEVDSVYFDSIRDEEVVALSGCGYLEKDTCCVKYSFSSRYGFYKWDYTWNNTQRFTMTMVQ